MDIDPILISMLTSASDKKYGPCVTLKNWEHLDYIEDVLTEHFDLDYEFKISDDEEKKYVLYFVDNASQEELQKAILTINEFHTSTGQLYETI